jgi:Xaa-Pro aminopeptidase
MRLLLFLSFLLLPSLAAAAEVSPEVFAERRARVMEELDGGVAVLYGDTGSEPLIQDSDFYYLTGVSESGAALILAPGESRYREILYLRPRNPEVEDWEGRRAGLGDSLEGAWGFEEIRRTNRLGRDLTRMLDRSRKAVFLGPIVSTNSPVPESLEMLRKAQSRVPGSSLENRADLIASLRRVKSDLEIELLQRAIDITGEGIKAIMRQAEPGLTEYQVQSILDHTYRMHGAQWLGFPSILAHGDNATVLHYTHNTAAIQPSGLILVDTGAAYEHYSADVSRTFPVSGTFTERERELYELVLRAQEAAIEKVRVGNVYYEDIHLTAKGVLDEAGYGKYFLHSTGHFLGLDVHDVGDYDQPLEPGVVITVEPGIYLPDEGIGIRIEDDVLVTEDGPVVLSRHIPRTVEEIEAWMAGEDD